MRIRRSRPPLWAYVFGEPIGRQVMADALLFGLAINYRTSGGELIAKSEIVHEAGYFRVGLATHCLARDDFRKGWKLRDIDVGRFCSSPIGDGRLFGQVNAHHGHGFDVARIIKRGRKVYH